MDRQSERQTGRHSVRLSGIERSLNRQTKNESWREGACLKSLFASIPQDVMNDVGGAQAMGIQGILVKTGIKLSIIIIIIIVKHSCNLTSVFTGKYRDGDEALINPAPTAVCDNFAQAVELILS